MTEPACERCRWFKLTNEDEHGAYGECRRFPPILSPMDQEMKDEFEHNDDGSWRERYEFSFVNWVWPQVTENEFCGEFKSKEVDDASE